MRYAPSSLFLALFMLTACGGAETDTSTLPTDDGAGGASTDSGPPPDASRPEDAIALMRTGPLGEVLTAFIPAGLPVTAQTIPLEELVGGDTALAEHIDRARSLQMLFGVDDVAAYSVGVTGTIPAGHLAPGARGELDRGAKWAIDRADPETGSPLFCIASPSADGDRLICGPNRAALVRAAPFMARTVAGMRLDGPQVKFEALLDSPTAAAIRERLPAKLAEVVTGVEGMLGAQTTGILANVDVQREILAFLRSGLDAVRSVIVDATEADFTVSVRDGNYVLETRARYATLSSEWFGALMSALRTPAGWPTDLFARLPSDAVTYALGTSDSRHVAPIMAQIKALMDALLNGTTALPAADRDALRTALDAMVTPEIAMTATASNMGRDQWNVVLARTVEGPTTAERIARFRALRTAFARRGVATAIETLTTVAGRPLFVMRDVRDMTSRELPPGGYGIRFKIRAPAPLATDENGMQAPCGTEVECVLRQLAPAEDTTYELVLAPLGTDFVLLLGKQTRPLWNAIQASTGPGVTPGAPAVAEAQMFPARMFVRMQEQLGTPAIRINAGDLPIVVRLEPAGEGPGGLLDMDVAIPVQLVQAIVGIAVMGMGAMTAPVENAAETPPE